jgi:hypothetical protein
LSVSFLLPFITAAASARPEKAISLSPSGAAWSAVSQLLDYSHWPDRLVLQRHVMPANITMRLVVHDLNWAVSITRLYFH